jgi:hypothetical protein
MLYDIQRQSQEQTVKIFDAFYKTNTVIPTNQWDFVKSYFDSVCDTKQIAANFTAVFFRMAQENGIDAMILLEELQGRARTKVDLSQVMAYYFNSFKSKTSLYGLSVVPTPNQAVARNVVL